MTLVRCRACGGTGDDGECINCDGHGTVCDTCGKSFEACDCDEEDKPPTFEERPATTNPPCGERGE